MTIDTPAARRNLLARFAGPAFIAISALCMLYWSWGTWPDPLVDFGTHLYVPWQLSLGKVLYRDIAYYNGPFSPYFNALMFRLGGVSIRTLVVVNLFIMVAVMVLAYRLTLRASGVAAALMGGLTFAIVFAFGHIVSIGNYNWVTPYAHEATHGAALGLLAIACVNRFHRKGRWLWLAAAGIATGCACLTKVEPALATVAAVMAQLALGAWTQRAGFRFALITAAVFVGSALAGPVAFAVFFATHMPIGQAVHGVLGSWNWALDRRITSLAFYQNINGLNDIPGNLAKTLRWSGVYLALIGSALLPAWFARRAGKTVRQILPVLLFAVIGIALLSRIDQTDWTGTITPLPICLTVILIGICIRIVRQNPADDRTVLRAALVVFSIVLLLKMGLKPLLYHYGFVLAWPGTVVLIAAVACDLPDWVTRRGGIGGAVRAVGLAVWCIVVLVMLRRDGVNFDSKRWTISPGTPDAFRAGTCGLEVQAVCDQIRQLIPETGTVAVFPQGLMINYLTRRANPIPNVNFMPPEVLAAGEDTFIHALQQHPPDLIIVTSSVIQDKQFTLDGRDVYGAKMLKWITQNYQAVDVVKLSPPLPTIYRFVVSRRRTP